MISRTRVGWAALVLAGLALDAVVLSALALLGMARIPPECADSPLGWTHTTTYGLGAWSFASTCLPLSAVWWLVFVFHVDAALMVIEQAVDRADSTGSSGISGRPGRPDRPRRG